MSKKSASFRVGKVQGYLRSKIWYLCYHENGKRRRPRIGPAKEAARQLAAQINAQLEIGAPAALSFEPIAIPQLRERWLEHQRGILLVTFQTVNPSGWPTSSMRFTSEPALVSLRARSMA